MKYSYNFCLIIHCLLISFLFTSCASNSDSVEFKEAITFTGVTDVGNSQTSSDIYLRFNYDELVVDEIRIVVVPQSMASSFDREAAENVSPASYQSINASAGRFEDRLKSDLLDVNGNMLMNGTTYEVMFLLVREGTVFVSDMTSTLELTDQHPLIGRYQGTWNDTFYNNFSITAKINEFNEGTLRGELFYTDDFTPCCNAAQAGAINDGTITLEINEEQNQIEYYRYDQVLLTFQGGCNGLYEGQGAYNSLELLITFTGNDCEGFHNNGRIELDRVF